MLEFSQYPKEARSAVPKWAREFGKYHILSNDASYTLQKRDQPNITYRINHEGFCNCCAAVQWNNTNCRHNDMITQVHLLFRCPLHRVLDYNIWTIPDHYHILQVSGDRFLIRCIQCENLRGVAGSAESGNVGWLGQYLNTIQAATATAMIESCKSWREGLRK